MVYDEVLLIWVSKSAEFIWLLFTKRKKSIKTFSPFLALATKQTLWLSEQGYSFVFILNLLLYLVFVFSLYIFRLFDNSKAKGLRCPWNPFRVVLTLYTRSKSHRSSWYKHSSWPALHWLSFPLASPTTGNLPGCWPRRGRWSSEWSKKQKRDQAQGLCLQREVCIFRLPSVCGLSEVADSLLDVSFLTFLPCNHSPSGSAESGYSSGWRSGPPMAWWSYTV